ncbi:hypothetical protein FQN54_003273 [Arachnomyces sp. PD_36]|nr:hypothetical protein FQN54_003273 [Arachnomyces sp. PD_36]
MAHVAMEATEQSRSGPQLDPDLFIDTIGVENGYLGDLNGLYDMDDLQNGFDLQTPQNLPDFLSLNLPETSSESPPMQGITNSPLSDTRDSNPPDSSNDGRSIESSSNTGCPCIHGAVRVVQQLDDDDFQLTKLTLDQVVQLQKWILSQCCKPLDCPNCRHLLTVHTVLVIICNRLSEMFECISIRIKRASQRLSGQSDPSSKSTASPDSDESEVYSTTTSGLPGTNAGCNPGLFSSEFQSRYSDEEQIHMIRVLLNLQLRNFRALLVRLDDQIQVASRRSKVKPVMLRLDRATTEIDIALNEVLQFFAI